LIGNHDGLMARVAALVPDKRVLKLIREFLNAGVMKDGLVLPVDEGTSQGGPLSPLQTTASCCGQGRGGERCGKGGT
jgi:retron-type reverse transcriptase